MLSIVEGALASGDGPRARTTRRLHAEREGLADGWSAATVATMDTAACYALAHHLQSSHARLRPQYCMSFPVPTR